MPIIEAARPKTVLTMKSGEDELKVEEEVADEAE